MSETGPSNLIQLQSAAKGFGSKTLFRDATFSINAGEHVGVIGPNGAGKTTLFKILAQELDVDDGEVVRSKSLRLGYLRQHDTWDTDQTLEEFFSEGLVLPIWELKKLALGLGLKDEQFYAPIKTLSGGYRMRAKLLHLLGQQPNLMMLDEPTNYLDLETTLVLEEFLQSFDGSFLLISHDREFLRRTTDHILEIEAGSFVKFSGNIDDYFEQKEMLRSQLEARAMTEAAKRKEVLDFAARFGAKASKARQVQSRLKQLAKRETIEVKPLPVSAKIRIPAPTHTGRVVMKIEDCDFGYGDKAIIQRVQCGIEAGDHLAVVGYNGAGKSTLLKSIAKEIPSLFGEVEWGYQVSCAYYAQHVAERLLPEETVHDALKRAAHPDVKPQEILDLAGGLLFSGDAIKKKVSVLSGGEKARVALGQILLQKSPVLILDEPTNHLDFYTVESLTQALSDFKGSVIFVSHDRGFVRRIATKVLEVSQGQATFYPGTYDDYVWSVEAKAREGFVPPDPKPLISRRKLPVGEKSSPAPSSSPAKMTPVMDKEKLKGLESQRREVDKNLQDIDKKIKILESRMNQQGEQMQGLQGQELAKLSQEVAATQRKIAEFEETYMRLLEDRETLLQQISELKGS